MLVGKELGKVYMQVPIFYKRLGMYQLNTTNKTKDSITFSLLNKYYNIET